MAYCTEMASHNQVGYWITLLLSLVGLCSNVLLLVTTHRLSWFTQPKAILFWNRAIIDLFACLSAMYLYSTLISEYLNSNVVESYLKAVPFHLFTTASGRFALALAIDRLMSQWFTVTWLIFGKRIRWIFVAVCWIWSLVSIAVFYSDSSSKIDVSSCLGCVSYADSKVKQMVIVVDNMINLSVLIIYIIIPLVVSSRLQIKNVVQFEKFLKLTKRFCGICVVVFLFSMTVGQFFGEVIFTLFYSNTILTIASETICSIGKVLNSVYPFYMLLFLNEMFRSGVCYNFSLLRAKTRRFCVN